MNLVIVYLLYSDFLFLTIEARYNIVNGFHVLYSICLYPNPVSVKNAGISVSPTIKKERTSGEDEPRGNEENQSTGEGVPID
jgi:hypothetical protein